MIAHRASTAAVRSVRLLFALADSSVRASRPTLLPKVRERRAARGVYRSTWEAVDMDAPVYSFIYITNRFLIW